MSSIAALFIRDKTFYCKILFDGAVTPVTFIRSYPFSKSHHLLKDIETSYDGTVEVISHAQFSSELDHIKLFGGRAPDGHLEGIVAPSEEELIAHFENYLNNPVMPPEEDLFDYDKVFEDLDISNEPTPK